MDVGKALVGSAPGESIGDKLKLALLRAFRTFLQGVVAAFPAGAAGTEIVSAGYWEAFGYAVIAAAITALASFLQNAASFLPEDPTQKDVGAPPPQPTQPQPGVPTGP